MGTLSRQVNNWLHEHADCVFSYVHGWTYSDVAQQVDACAIRLHEQGVAERHLVALYAANSQAAVIAFLALLKLDAVPILVHHYYQPEQVQDIIGAFSPHALLTDTREGVATNPTHFDIGERTLYLSSAITRDAQDIPPQVAVIGMTSGTTNRPKGVMLTDSNLLSNIESIGRYLGLTSKDRMLIMRSLSHASVFTGEFLVALAQGCAVDVIDQFNVLRIHKWMQAHQITITGGSPSMIRSLSNLQKKLETSLPLQKILISGSPVSAQVLAEIVFPFPDVKFYHGYGLTEASPRISCLLPQDFRRKMSSVGRPLTNVTVKIIDEAGQEAPPMQVGEIVATGPNVMFGYYGHEPLSGSTIATGDLGYLDDEGFLYVIGRKDDLIIRAGINIYPSEIEEALLQHPSVTDAFVYGSPDDVHGHRIHAWVVVDEAASEMLQDDIFQHCVRLLGSARIPQEIRIVPEIATNAVGKRVKPCLL
ncbi:class I adenylate-forming enzyme family protein [Alicyclobacillus fodiniaquatilis]|uniref:Class I adenylate-forming enzyme family protein n=1 Tax=Alicyclobacillus fodiniaquatilis TaxID=1661150 RepID=A0ABW4JE78_9BACL